MFILLQLANEILKSPNTEYEVNINKNKFYYGILGVYLFNSGLHFFYGNPSAFLYTCHFNFSIIIVSDGYKKIEKPQKVLT